MVLVDTTVWIDFFLNRSTKQVLYLTDLIENQDEICTCGIVLTEIFQGIKNKREENLIKENFDSLIFLDMTKDTFFLAADVFRHLRSKGITIRKTLDCMIAAVAMENKVKLLHNDRDFDPIHEHYNLKVIT